MKGSDLDPLDRATIRLWRSSNLVGWCVAGTALYGAPSIAMAAATEAFRGRLSAVIAAPVIVVFIGASLVLLPALVGRIVGEHVYRWPALIASVAVALPHAYRFVTLDADLDRTDVMAILTATAIPVFVAAVTARDRWSKRPRALRAPASR